MITHFVDAAPRMESRDADAIPPARSGFLRLLRRNRINPAELSVTVAASLGLSKAADTKTVDAVFAAIADAAAKGDEVSVNGFGKFNVKASPALEGRNPSTGAAIQTAASKKLSFGAPKAVKDRLSG